MSALELIRYGEHFFFDNNQSYDWAKSLSHEYNAADPFPHIVIDDFLPVDLMTQMLHHFPAPEECSVVRNTPHTSNKRGYRPDDMRDNICRNHLYMFNTSPFLQFLEQLTGIEGLISDPHFFGGGFQETMVGGKLGVHADFNLHPDLGLTRRINVLLYLNREWQSDYGGYLELWNGDMSRWVHSIEPRFNRCVIFNTNKSSFHGHPQPIKGPRGLSRRSIALYYYTCPPRGEDRSSEFDTQTDFPERPSDILPERVF